MLYAVMLLFCYAGHVLMRCWVWKVSRRRVREAEAQRAVLKNLTGSCESTFHCCQQGGQGVEYGEVHFC
jgi:hypothetical protein